MTSIELLTRNHLLNNSPSTGSLSEAQWKLFVTEHVNRVNVKKLPRIFLMFFFRLVTELLS